MAVAYTPAIAEVIEKLEVGNPLPTLVPRSSAWNAELTDALDSSHPLMNFLTEHH